MITTDKYPIRIAILDLNDGFPNQAMRCIRQVIDEWAATAPREVIRQEFDVRQKKEMPDTSFDIYISTGGPGDPVESRVEEWDIAWCKLIDDLLQWNNNPSNSRKKYVFFICHSFQLACRFFNSGLVCKRKSTSFGVFPVHMLEEGAAEPVFDGLNDPFYAVDSRDYQVIQPNHKLIREIGGTLLCIEKSRPHVPYERAVMGIRFNDYMVGTQFHPEADALGMKVHFEKEDKRKTVIENFGEAKLNSMLEHLEDPDKILWTYSRILPNFLNQSSGLSRRSAVA